MALRYGSGLAWQLLSDEVIIVDLETKKVLGLNPVGSLVWSLVETHQPTTIVEEIIRHFDIDSETAKKDISAFIEKMSDRGLLEYAG